MLLQIIFVKELIDFYNSKSVSMTLLLTCYDSVVIQKENKSTLNTENQIGLYEV